MEPSPEPLSITVADISGQTPPATVSLPAEATLESAFECIAAAKDLQVDQLLLAQCAGEEEEALGANLLAPCPATLAQAGIRSGDTLWLRVRTKQSVRDAERRLKVARCFQ